jgi:hypothetical protein
MRQTIAAMLLLLPCAACPALGINPDEEYKYIDPKTGQEVTTTVGDHMADQIEESGSVIGSVIGKVVGVATGNPVVGVSASALLAALIGTGTSKLRKKKKVSDSQPTGGAPEATGTSDSTA